MCSPRPDDVHLVARAQPHVGVFFTAAGCVCRWSLAPSACNSSSGSPFNLQNRERPRETLVWGKASTHHQNKCRLSRRASRVRRWACACPRARFVLSVFMNSRCSSSSITLEVQPATHTPLSAVHCRAHLALNPRHAPFSSVSGAEGSPQETGDGDSRRRGACQVRREKSHGAGGDRHPDRRGKAISRPVRL